MFSGLSRCAGVHESMVGRWIAVLLLLGGLFCVVPLAYASPPDPLWMPGIYDDADLDDVVVSIAALSGLYPPPPIVLSRWSQGVLEAPRPPQPLSRSLISLDPRESRAPPSS